MSTGKSTLLVSADLVTPVRLLVDSIQAKIYWSDSGANRIERANPDGSGREVFYQGALGEYPFGLYLDQQQGHLYWTDYGVEKVRRANLDGTGVTDVIATGLSDPVAVVIVPKYEKPGGKERKVESALTEKPKVTTYPNPTDNLLTVASMVPGQPMEWVCIYDKAGKEVYRTEINANSVNIDTRPFSDGSYHYFVSISGQVLSGRFSIIR